jgi:hypothetical protein
MAQAFDLLGDNQTPHRQGGSKKAMSFQDYQKLNQDFFGPLSRRVMGIIFSNGMIRLYTTKIRPNRGWSRLFYLFV